MDKKTVQQNYEMFAKIRKSILAGYKCGFEITDKNIDFDFQPIANQIFIVDQSNREFFTLDRDMLELGDNEHHKNMNFIAFIAQLVEEIENRGKSKNEM